MLGVPAAQLGAGNFVFNEEPVTQNAGTMSIADGAIMPLGGIVENTGTIALNGAGGATQLEVIVNSLTLKGGGQVTLSDSDGNLIFGGAPEAVLNNVDNTISGAGQIGGGQLTLVNAGTIDANGSHALVIDTGSIDVTNSGVLEASGSGGLIILNRRRQYRQHPGQWRRRRDTRRRDRVRHRDHQRRRHARARRRLQRRRRCSPTAPRRG